MEKKYINWIPMPCVKCNKVTKVPEHSLYCRECNPDPVEEFDRNERHINRNIIPNPTKGEEQR